MYIHMYIASRMGCLARLLPLTVREVVPEDDKNWRLFLTLLTVIDYVFAPRTSQEVVSYLAALIKDHHEEFKRLYPDSPITPKLHNMIHIFLTLLTVIDYVFPPRTSQEVVSYLAVLIKDHHEEFKRLYPDSPITPKLHNMIHIPE